MSIPTIKSFKKFKSKTNGLTSFKCKIWSHSIKFKLQVVLISSNWQQNWFNIYQVFEVILQKLMWKVKSIGNILSDFSKENQLSTFGYFLSSDKKVLGKNIYLQVCPIQWLPWAWFSNFQIQIFIWKFYRAICWHVKEKMYTKKCYMVLDPHTNKGN